MQLHNTQTWTSGQWNGSVPLLGFSICTFEWIGSYYRDSHSDNMTLTKCCYHNYCQDSSLTNSLTLSYLKYWGRWSVGTASAINFTLSPFGRIWDSLRHCMKCLCDGATGAKSSMVKLILPRDRASTDSVQNRHNECSLEVWRSCIRMYILWSIVRAGPHV